MSTSDRAFDTILGVAAAIEAKELSPVALATSQLERIEQLDGRLKSFATVTADHAMAAAAAAEREIAAGNYRGPLHGVPIAVKDLCFTKGVRTMGGAAVLADHIPDFDATVVTRLEEAGAVLLGKLNLTEGAMAGYNPAFELPLNPWDAECWSGASSSGSGVATAAGLCFGSLGNDTGGSIRFPAAACGVVGLKPTWGRVSRHGVLALAESLDHIGPITRSTADAAVIFETIAGFDENDPTSLRAAVPDCLTGIDAGIRDVRIGLDRAYVSEGVAPEVATAIFSAADVLSDLGAQVVEVSMPDLASCVEAWSVLCGAEAAAAHAATYPSRADEYGPWFRSWLEHGHRVSGVDYARANAVRLALNGRLRETFADIDVLACPAMPDPAFPITRELMYDSTSDDFDMSILRFTAPFDFNGAPTLNLPSGLSDEGLPLSLQLAGKHLGEALLCRVGHAFEQATEWHQQRPPID
jgi:amidase